MKSLLDSTFRYTNAASTDIAKTFARIRREQEAARKAAAESSKKILPMKKSN